MVYREAEDVRDVKIKSREAVDLAMGGRWDEAAAVNREVIAAAPSDIDAYNRLGKALLELGDPQAARAAFQHSISLDPSNSIARKNLERLSNGTASGGAASLSNRAFIGETGKSAQVALLGCAMDTARPYLAAGSAIELREHKGNLVVYSTDGQYVGIVPPRVGHRLVTLMEGGNKYGGAVLTSSADTVRVVLHESYQHPSLRSKMSFPALAAEAPAPVVPTIEPAGDLTDDAEPAAATPIAETPAEELRELDGPDAELEVATEPDAELNEGAALVDAADQNEAGAGEEEYEEELEEAI
jgi:hypothetical protein